MRLTVIIAALVIALLVVFGIGGFFGNKKQEPAPIVLDNAPQPVQTEQTQVNVYVARQDIPVGTVLNSGLYDIKPVASYLIPPGAIKVNDPTQAKIDDMITSTPIVANQPILIGMLRNPNDPSFIAGQLGEGMRAVSISVGMTESIAGFVAPGDKVDILYTHNLSVGSVETGVIKSPKAGIADENQVRAQDVAVAEILMPNIKVLAVDKRVSSAGSEAEGLIPTSVTLEVNQRDAQKLRLAEKMGKLSLALRSVKDKDRYDIVRPTAEQDLTRTMPPAYFPALFDSDAPYDFKMVDLYGGSETGAVSAKRPNSEKENIKVYRGSALEKVEVKK
jgi:pilus assembly protein CpaB